MDSVTSDEMKGTVTFRHNKQPLVLSVAEPGAPDGVAGRTFNLKSADSGQLLGVYQELARRTVLQSPSLPRAKINLQSAGPLSAEAALVDLAQALAGKSIALVPQGTKFTFAIPTSWVARLQDIRPPEEDDPNALEEFPAGLIKFDEAELFQVLEIYQELSGRTVIAAANIPGFKITLRTQTPLTRREAVFTLETAIRLGDVTVHHHQDKYVIVQPSLSGEPPQEFPSNQSAAARPRTKTDPAGHFLRLSRARPEEFLTHYAALLGREALPVESDLPQLRLRIRSQSVLTTAEAVYALDALAAVNRLQFVLVGDRQVKLVSAPTGPPVARPKPE